MFVNFFNTFMLLSREVFRGLRGFIPLPGLVKYMLLGGPPPPPKKKKKCKPFLGKKNLNTPLLISLKLCLSSQPLLNLSKYKSEDQEIYFEDLHFSVSQILHSLFYRLCMQALLCCLKLFIVQ